MGELLVAAAWAAFSGSLARPVKCPSRTANQLGRTHRRVSRYSDDRVMEHENDDHRCR